MKDRQTSEREYIQHLNDVDRFSFSSLLNNDVELNWATRLGKLRDLLYFEHAVDSIDDGLKRTHHGQYFHLCMADSR